MKPLRLLSVTGAAVLVLTAAACSSSGSSGSSAPSSGSTTPSSGSTTAAASSVFGTPKKATGSPYVFGMINDETGAVTFPEARQGAIAAVDYVNNYLDGINGHPIVIDECTGDGTPATAARCANQLVAQHPMAILGAADVGAPASIPIYEHANLAYLGGIPFTPVPETAPDSIQFWSVSVGDNAAAAVYAGKTLGIKSVALIYFNNAQGSSILPQITPVFKAAGVTTIHDIPLSPTSPDPSPQAALVESSGAQLAYVDVPNGCGNVLKALKSVGFTGKIMGIDPCSAPPVIAAVHAAERDQPAGAAVRGGDEEVGRTRHADRLDLHGRLRHRDERPAGAEHDLGHADDDEHPGRVQVRHAPELPVAPVHVQRAGAEGRDRDLQRLLPHEPGRERGRHPARPDLGDLEGLFPGP
jgi:hypothetical protein